MNNNLVLTVAVFLLFYFFLLLPHNRHVSSTYDISLMPEYCLSSMCFMNHYNTWSADLFTGTRNYSPVCSGRSRGHAITLAQPLTILDLKSNVLPTFFSPKSLLEPALNKQILHTLKSTHLAQQNHRVIWSVPGEILPSQIFWESLKMS